MQEKLKDALEKLNRGKEVKLTGCGRTDTGVHASAFYAHVDFDSNEAVQKAMGKAGQNLDGRDVRVDASTPRQGGGDRKLIFKFLNKFKAFSK